MLIDQKWVIENFHIIDKIFTRLNKSEQNLDRERKNMKKNMDKLKFRGYYELARKQEKDKVNKAKTIGDKEEKLRMDQIMEVNASHTKNAISNADEAIDILDDQLKVKDKQINSLTDLMSEKDKQISDLLELSKEKDKQIEKLMEIISQK